MTASRSQAPERTLIDLAATCGRFELETAVAEAFARGLTDRERLLEGDRASARQARRQRGCRAVLEAPAIARPDALERPSAGCSV